MGMLKSSAVLILPVLLLGAVPARAQTPASMALPKFFGIFTPTVGAWSEYAMTETGTGKKSTMRNAVVGKEGDLFWYEVAITEAGARNVIKMLLKGDPNNPENIQRLIMKNGDQPAQEMPREFVMLGRRMATAMFETRTAATVANQQNLKFEEIGKSDVTVPAGTFPAIKYRLVDPAGKVLATYDWTDKILPFGVLHSETDKAAMDLVAYGKDAASVITEQPTMMKTPPGMPDANPRGKPPGMPPPGNAAPPASGGYGSPAPAAPAPAPATGGYGK